MTYAELLAFKRGIAATVMLHVDDGLIVPNSPEALEAVVEATQRKLVMLEIEKEKEL